MGWKQFSRQVAAAGRRQARANERAAVARFRELQRQQREQAKADERARAAADYERYETYIELLKSVHKDCGDAWDWHAVASAEAPPEPKLGNRRELNATRAKEAYQPSWFDNLFGLAKGEITNLEAAVLRAQRDDRAEYETAYATYQSALALWEKRRSLATRVLAGDPDASGEALDYVEAFSELVDFGTRVTVMHALSDVVTLQCEIVDNEIVPTDEVKLTASGKLTMKTMPAARYWDLYQDHVCSCALRVARETFAALPVRASIVNVGRMLPNPSTGHIAFTTFLAVCVERDKLERLNLDRIDPSESLRNFQHRMVFKKSAGFTPVEAMLSSEHWATK